MDENYTEPDLSKIVKQLMDEEGYEFGEAVKKAMEMGYKDGGLMVAIQKFNQGGNVIDSRATVEDMAKSIQSSSAATNDQKLQLLMDYDNANRQSQKIGNYNPANLKSGLFTNSNQTAMEKLLGLQTNPNFQYTSPIGPMMLMPPTRSTGFRQDPGYFSNPGIMINGKRYMSEDEAIDDMGVETYNRFMADGGMAGGKTYHQFHDQYVPMDEESMGYAYGGGIGSMMQPRQNYLIGGEVEENIDFSNMGLQNIINSDLPQNTQVAGGYDSPNEGAYGFNLIELDRLKDAGYDPAELSGYENREDVQSLIRSLEPTANKSTSMLDSIINSGINVMSDVGNSIFSPAAASEITPSGVRNFRDIAGENLPSGIMSGYTQPSADYPDMIRNPENFPNALQNLERYQDNRFEDLDFQTGYDFIDAPNKTNTLQELYQNRNFINNPRTGFIDNTILSRGNPDASLMNKTKNAISSGIGSIMDFASNIPTPFGLVRKFANARNPLSPTSQNYNPNLQGQIDSLTGRTGTLTSGTTTFMSPEDIAAGNFGTKSGAMITKDSGTGLDKYGPGSVLSGQNVVSGFGTNDYMGQLEKELDKMKNRAMKKDLTKFQQKKQQDILNEIQAEKDRVANELAISQAAAKAAAASFMSRNPNYGNNYNPDREGGYTGATDSYGDKSGTRQSNARSSDLGFSDIRLKDNIELVGKSPSAINIYNFTYLNDPKVYQGVMAHEVPWASVKHDNGYLMVDYKKVDVDFKAIR